MGPGWHQEKKGLLMLPGLLGTGEMLFEQILAFEHTYRVIVPCYPPAIKNAQQLVRGLTKILDIEQVDRVHLLGGSYSGMVAQCLVRQYPNRIDKLILSHTGPPQTARAAKNRRILILVHVLPTWKLQALLRLSMRRALADAPRQRTFWEGYSDQVIDRIKKADLLSRYQVAIDFDRTWLFGPQDLKEWPGQILILEGDNDTVASSKAKVALKALYPQASVHVFHGSGHLASIAKLDEYVTTIKNFLESQQELFKKGALHGTQHGFDRIDPGFLYHS
jgi:pimeloyl-ACP methyl ester carboxylesterase